MAVDGIDVSWAAVPEADGYNIYSWNSAKKAYDLLTTVEGADTTNATIYGVKAGSTYSLKVSAYNIIDKKQIVGYGGTAKITVPKNFSQKLEAPIATATNNAATTPASESNCTARPRHQPLTSAHASATYTMISKGFIVTKGKISHEVSIFFSFFVYLSFKTYCL